MLPTWAWFAVDITVLLEIRLALKVDTEECCVPVISNDVTDTFTR
jgi:hypothetical protein